MRPILYVTSGTSAGMRVPVGQTDPVTVGRARAALVLADDDKLAPTQFELQWDGESCRLFDRSKGGTTVNGESVTETTLNNGSLITAGETTFLLRLLPDDLRAQLPPIAPKPPPTPALIAAREDALGQLRAESNLYVILDAARDARIPAFLRACDEQPRSLLRGHEGQALAEVAPYLVQLADSSPLLDVLVNDGWGDSWGVYLTSSRPPSEVKQRLSRSLLGRPKRGAAACYFRFYDPRVLRDYLPSAKSRVRSEMLAGLDAFIVEGPDGEMLRFEP